MSFSNSNHIIQPTSTLSRNLYNSKIQNIITRIPKIETYDLNSSVIAKKFNE